MTTPTSSVPEIEYPDSDGKPMADNTLQFQWIVTIKENLEALYHDEPNVFVAGDLLWYPVEGRPEICSAPDTLVVFGRPKGYRGSYMQWREGGIAPQVVFEILSPNNSRSEMERKREFFERHGVEEYYLYDPESPALSAWIRQAGRLRPLPDTNGWISPRLGIRFDLSGGELVIFRPDGQPFLTFGELMQQADELRKQAEESRQQAEESRQQAEESRQQAEQEKQARAELQRRAEQLAERLRALGVDPDTI